MGDRIPGIEVMHAEKRQPEENYSGGNGNNSGGNGNNSGENGNFAPIELLSMV